MTHPKARTKPRRRERRDPQDRIILTAKGRAILAAHDLRVLLIARRMLARGQPHHEHGRATPCAPNRGNDAPATLPAHDAGTAGAPPAHPAAKSGAAELAKEPQTDQ